MIDALVIAAWVVATVCCSLVVGYWRGRVKGHELGEAYGRETADIDEWETIGNLRSANSDLERQMSLIRDAREEEEQAKLRTLLARLNSRWDATGSTTLLTRQEWLDLHTIAAVRAPREDAK